MPIYEYFCEGCRIRFERIRPMSECAQPSQCPQCEFYVCEVVPSSYNPRPDTLWAGHVHRNYGYHTSTSSLKEEMKRRNHVTMGDRTDREGWEKIADEANKAKDEKLKKNMRQWSEKTFGPSGLGLGGADGEKFIRENS